ncbi:hypothetical protein BDQ17DRAFT_1336699, partial [Cyathus striatus]
IIHGDIYMKVATFKDKDIYCRHYELTEAFTSTNKPQGFPLDSLNGVNRLLSARLRVYQVPRSEPQFNTTPRTYRHSATARIIIDTKHIDCVRCVIKPIISYGFRRITNLSPTEMRNKKGSYDKHNLLGYWHVLEEA